MWMFALMTQQRQVRGNSATQVTTRGGIMEGTRSECFTECARRITELWGGDESGVVTFFYCEPDDPHPPAVSRPQQVYSSPHPPRPERGA